MTNAAALVLPPLGTCGRSGDSLRDCVGGGLGRRCMTVDRGLVGGEGVSGGVGVSTDFPYGFNARDFEGGGNVRK